MTAIKRNAPKTAASPGRLIRLIRFLLGPAQAATIVALLVAGLFVAWYFTWYHVEVGQDMLAGDDYRVTPEDVQITPPPPEWIHSDIRAQVFRSAIVGNTLSIMDDDLTERVADAFALHPWVAKVLGVAKHHPAQVTVELAYRRPVCMVDVSGGMLPVDAQGVLLPAEDFSPVEASRYPRLLSIDTVPVGTMGEPWGDVRVVGGAEIAEVLGPFWEKWKLADIVPTPSGINNEYTYTLVTRGGTRIRWGLAPGSRAPGELPPADKVDRLDHYLKEYGRFDRPKGPKELDVHQL